MNLSNNGGVLIIDDTFEEIQNLLQLLSSKGIPYIYLNGDLDKLPQKPLTGIRFIFLDIELNHTRGQRNSKVKAAAVAKVVDSVISKDNGPYSILFWSKHREEYQNVISYLVKKPPVFCTILDKSDYIEPKDNIIEELYRHLQLKIQEIKAFRLYTEWENIAKAAAVHHVNNLASCFPFDEKWDIKTMFLFYKLYNTYLENDNDTSDIDKTNAILHMLNRGYLDKVEELSYKTSFGEQNFLNRQRIDRTIFESFFSSDPSITSQYTIADEQYILKTECNSNKNKEKFEEYVSHSILNGGLISSINTSLFISEINNNFKPGSVYLSKKKNLKDAIIKHIDLETSSFGSVSLCKMIITPECDLAQSKTLVGNSGPCHRIVYGLLLKCRNDITQKDFLKKYKKLDCIYRIGPLWYKECVYYLLLDYSSITNFPEKNIQGKYLFTVKRDLFFDLQSKAANHVNRLGNYMLS